MSDIIPNKAAGQNKIGEIFLTRECQIFFACSSCGDSVHSDFWELVSHLSWVHDIHVLYNREEEFMDVNTLKTEQQVDRINGYLKKEEEEVAESEAKEFSWEHNETAADKELESFDLYETDPTQSENTQSKELMKENTVTENANKDNATKNRISPIKKASSEKSRHHICPECDKSFSLSKNLIRHLRTIHEARQYKCKSCCQTFSRKDNLISHNRMQSCQHKSSAKNPSRNTRSEPSTPKEDNLPDAQKGRQPIRDTGDVDAPSIDFYKEIKFNSDGLYSCNICNWECGVLMQVFRHMKTHING